MFLTLFFQNNARRFQSYMTKDHIQTLCVGKSDVIKLIKDLDVIKQWSLWDFS